MLLGAYPVTTDPELGNGPVTPAHDLRRLRDRLITALLNHSDKYAAEVLDRLAVFDPIVRARVDTHRANQLAAQYLPAIDPSAARDPDALSVRDAVLLLNRAGFRLIRSPDDLLDAVLEALRSVNADVGDDLAMLYSNPDRKRNRKPLYEDALQAYLRRRLIDELRRLADRIEVTIFREDQIARRQRLDLRILAPLYGGSGLTQVVVEVKWSMNSETRTGLVEQLGDRYLIGEGLTHGVFLVGWTGEWRSGDGSRAKTDKQYLNDFLTTQRDSYCASGQPGERLRIEPFVLDVEWSKKRK